MLAYSVLMGAAVSSESNILGERRGREEGGQRVVVVVVIVIVQECR
jgi:hypothetical protein